MADPLAAVSSLPDDGTVVVLDRRGRRGRARRAPEQEPLRVVIGDAQALVRAGLRALLESDGQIAVVGEAADAQRALALTHDERPDVVMVDAALPGLDSTETVRRLLADGRATVMLLVGSEDDERSFAALRAGAHGVLIKDTEPAELVRAVRVLARGEAVVPPQLTRRLIAEYAATPSPRLPASELLERLTAREREVVALVALGLTNDAIAERLVVTSATAKTHVSRAMVKLGARDRAQLVVFAYETGLVGTHVPSPPR